MHSIAADLARDLFGLCEGCNGVMWQEIVVAPYLLTGSTDSKHYASIVKGGIYRFSPLQLSMKAGDTHRIHGLDERVTVRSNPATMHL